jgi:hypothetical protein
MKNDYPLAINILKLQEHYNFKTTKLDEVVFFEWLVVKRESFGLEKFFYQQSRVFDEVGIRRFRLEKITELFESYGLTISVEGFSNVTHYSVTNLFIETFVLNHVNDSLQNKVLNNLLKLKFKKDKPLSKFQLKKVNNIVDRLNIVYETRRNIYSQNNGVGYKETQLPVNRKTLNQIHQLSLNYKLGAIENGFTAYCDEKIKEPKDSYHLLNHFSTYSKEDNKFSIFERSLHIFNGEYFY